MLPSLFIVQNGPPPGSPWFFTIPQTLRGRFNNSNNRFFFSDDSSLLKLFPGLWNNRVSINKIISFIFSSGVTSASICFKYPKICCWICESIPVRIFLNLYVPVFKCSWATLSIFLINIMSPFRSVKFSRSAPCPPGLKTGLPFLSLKILFSNVTAIVFVVFFWNE